MSNDETTPSSQEESSDKKGDFVPKERFDQVWAKSKNEEEKRRSIEGQLAEKEAELQRLELKATQAELTSKYPEATKYLQDNPELGLVADSKEEYIQKMEALDGRLKSGKEAEASKDAKPSEDKKQEEPEEKKGFVAPNPPSKEASSSEEGQDVTKLGYKEYGKLPAKERLEYLKALDEQQQQQS